jgi:prevent-host-death family protein
MPEIGIRELKNQASEIVRAVREERAEYVITHRGRPVAMIIPFEALPEEEAPASGQWWASIQEIGQLMEEETPDAKSSLAQLYADRAAS